MSVCAQCGQANLDDARFCSACGSSLVHEPERRKLATVLFCDVTGSTALGERIDAESVRDVMALYFQEMRGAIERHGGTIEKFIGDAVVAVFGVPVNHEDDALRAVRAADEMRQLAELNAILERRYGSSLAVRIGVNTGEVVAGASGTRQALVTGDAVNVAARLEQGARPGEVLIGETTFRLVRDAVTADRIAPFVAKGKAQPIVAYRLTSVDRKKPGRARRLDIPIVGRDAELAVLADLARAAAGGRCVLATVMGEPGVGKSRLAAELLATAGGARVLVGRCLQYGEGITYWPIAEVVRQAAEIRDEQTTAEAVGNIERFVSPADAAIIAEAIGLTAGKASTRQIGSSIGTFLAALARTSPVVLVFDDIHWAEAPLLELLASLPSRLVNERLMILCTARPDLIEKVPTWQATIRLQPLNDADTETLANHLLDGLPLAADIMAMISASTAGNALFVEELIGMLVDDGLLMRSGTDWVAQPGLASFSIPTTLRELLGARLDALSEGERGVLERGAVEGQAFHRGAVMALSDDARLATVGPDLRGLGDREYVRAIRPDFADEEAYRIRHVLIRDAAYEAIPKRTRADLHVRFADWLEVKAGDRSTEYEEILGHHLERAHRYLDELGPIGPMGAAAAARAAVWLERAGRRAYDRRDSQATVNLLSRATTLMAEEHPARFELLQIVGEELGFMMDVEGAARAFRAVIDGAGARGDHRLATHGRLGLSLMRFWTDPDYGALGMLADVESAARAFDSLGDLKGLARAHDWRAFVYSHLGRYSDSEREASRALELGKSLGEGRFAAEQNWYLVWAAAYGPPSVRAGIETCVAILREAGDDPAVSGHTLYSLSVLHSLDGRFAVARDHADRGLRSFDGLGMAFSAWHPLHRGYIDLMSGDGDGAVRHLRQALELLPALNDFPSASTAASFLADTLLDLERLAGIDELTASAEQWAPKDQPIQAARWRATRARLHARRLEPAAEGLAREGVELAHQTDHLILQGDALVALADVLRLAGQDAAPVIAYAMERYGLKGSPAAAALARRRLKMA